MFYVIKRIMSADYPEPSVRGMTAWFVSDSAACQVWTSERSEATYLNQEDAAKYLAEAILNRPEHTYDIVPVSEAQRAADAHRPGMPPGGGQPDLFTTPPPEKIQ